MQTSCIYGQAAEDGAGRVEAPMSPRAASLDVEELYASRRHEFVRFLMGFGVGAAEAEDITQDVFLTAFQPADDVRRPDNLFRWLLVCAKNLAINRYRRRKRDLSLSAKEPHVWDALLPRTEPDVESRIYAESLLRKVRRAVSDELTPLERNCLVLRSRGTTYRQVADQLSISMDRAVYLTGTAINKVHRQVGGML